MAVEIVIPYIVVITLSIFLSAMLYSFTGFREIGLNGWKYMLTGAAFFLASGAVTVIPWSTISSALPGADIIPKVLVGFITTVGFLLVLVGAIKFVTEVIRA